MSEQLVESLDVRMHVRWEVRRCRPVRNEQVEPRDHHEREEEHREQRELGLEHAPEHVVATEGIVPEVVDVEPGDRPAEDQHEEKQTADRDEDPAPADSTAWAVDRQVR